MSTRPSSGSKKLRGEVALDTRFTAAHICIFSDTRTGSGFHCRRARRTGLPAQSFIPDEAERQFLRLVVIPDVFRDRPGSVLAVEAAGAERLPIELAAALRVPGMQVVLHDLLDLRVEHRGALGGDAL